MIGEKQQQVSDEQSPWRFVSSAGLISENILQMAIRFLQENDKARTSHLLHTKSFKLTQHKAEVKFKQGTGLSRSDRSSYKRSLKISYQRT